MLAMDDPMERMRRRAALRAELSVAATELAALRTAKAQLAAALAALHATAPHDRAYALTAGGAMRDMPRADALAATAARLRDVETRLDRQVAVSDGHQAELSALALQ